MKKKKNTPDTKANPVEEEEIIIPEDEIWTYRIEGLQAPRISDRTVTLKFKILIISVLLVAISLSIYFSIRVVVNDEYKFSNVSTGIELVKYTNVNNLDEVTIDYANGDKTTPITEIHEYAFNCDEKIRTINIGKDVSKIDGKSFYYCTSLRNIFVDDENPWYCDLDGVLYNKDMTEIICYPMRHSLTGLADDAPWPEENVYFIPPTVTKIGKLTFAYSDITKIYIPDGVTELGMMAFFKTEKLSEIYSYTAMGLNGNATSEKDLKEWYKSLPDSLEMIGADCFSFDRALTYMYIPASVTNIAHHAFYNTCYKEDGQIIGLAQINAGLSEDDFKSNTKTGDSWLPQYENGLFKKNITVEYSSSREG